MCKWKGLIYVITCVLYLLSHASGARISNSLRDASKIHNSTHQAIQKSKVCQRTIQLDEQIGSIASPNYPLSYDDNITCLWQIQSKLGHLIQLSFEDFNLEGGIIDTTTGKFVCAYDFVHIYERFYVTSGKDKREKNSKSSHKPPVVLQKVWGTFCGSNPPRKRTTTLSGASLFIYFFTDANKSGRGFSATYKQVKLSGDGRLESNWDEEVESNRKTFNFYLAIFLTMSIGVMLVIVSLCKLLNKALDVEDESERRSFCCGTISVETGVDSEGLEQSIDERPPTPPPPYRDVVKTEEDWSRVIRQFGSATAEVLRRNLAAEDVTVSYNLNEINSANIASSNASGTITSSNTAPIARSGCLAAGSTAMDPSRISALLITTPSGIRFLRNFRSSRVSTINEESRDERSVT